jgi:hypothetical protein
VSDKTKEARKLLYELSGAADKAGEPRPHLSAEANAIIERIAGRRLRHTGTVIFYLEHFEGDSSKPAFDELVADGYFVDEHTVTCPEGHDMGPVEGLSPGRREMWCHSCDQVWDMEEVSAVRHYRLSPHLIATPVRSDKQNLEQALALLKDVCDEAEEGEDVYRSIKERLGQAPGDGLMPHDAIDGLQVQIKGLREAAEKASRLLPLAIECRLRDEAAAGHLHLSDAVTEWILGVHRLRNDIRNASRGVVPFDVVNRLKAAEAENAAKFTEIMGLYDKIAELEARLAACEPSEKEQP